MEVNILFLNLNITVYTFHLQVSLGQMYRHEKLVIEKTRWYTAMDCMAIPNAQEQRAASHWILTSSRTICDVHSTNWQNFWVKTFSFLSCRWCFSLTAIYFPYNPKDKLWLDIFEIFPLFPSCKSTNWFPKIRVMPRSALFDFLLKRE